MAVEIDHNSFDYKARWNGLRSIGNSAIARASIAVPILGYLIIFNSDLVNYLHIHTSFCQNCNVPWRLYFFYFACCSFGLGSALYGIWCPTLIKRYEGETDFYQAESGYFCNPAILEYLFELIKNRKGEAPDDPHQLLDRYIQTRMPLPAQELSALAGSMGELYLVENRTHKTLRKVVYLSYVIGFILLLIPTIITFAEIMMRAGQSLASQ